MEEWRQIDGFHYAVSNFGRVMRTNSGKGWRAGRIVAVRIMPNGYRQALLHREGKPNYRYIHRLVAAAFIGPPPSPKHEAAHLNGDRADNRPENLAWCTHKENEAHKAQHGTRLTGERSPNARISDADAVEIVALRGRKPQSEIARMYGISQQHVSSLQRGIRRSSASQGDQV